MIVVVDLDRTLIPFDSTIHAIKIVLISRPKKEIFISLTKGNEYFKNYLLKHVDWDTIDFPVNKAVLNYLIEMKKSGSLIYLVSGSSEQIVNAISRRIGVFDKSVGRNQDRPNMKFKSKLTYVNQMVGGSDWVYVADAYRDVVIWKKATLPILVSRSRIKYFLISKFRIKNIGLLRLNS